MFHTSSMINKINRVIERCSRIIYNDKRSYFQPLLVKDNFVSIHHNNIYTLRTKMCKAANGMSPEMMNGILKLRDHSDNHLRHTSKFLADLFPSVFKFFI